MSTVFATGAGGNSRIGVFGTGIAPPFQDASFCVRALVRDARSSKRCSLPVCVRGSSRDILDRARIFVGRDRRLHVLLQRAVMRRIAGLAGAQHHIGLDDLAALLVGRADHAAFGDRGMRRASAVSTSGPAML